MNRTIQDAEALECLPAGGKLVLLMPHPHPCALPATENRSEEPLCGPRLPLHCPELGELGRLLPCHVGFCSHIFFTFEQQAEEAGGSGLC